MTLYAHRGWSMGRGDGWAENTLSAFDKSKRAGITAVEVDLRTHPQTKEIILSHDPVKADKDYTTLAEALAYIKDAEWQIIIEFKEYDRDLFTQVQTLLAKYELQDRAVLFGFNDIAKNFPWVESRQVKLGIIVEYPWQIKGISTRHKPDCILLGWDDRKWTQLAFKLWWSVFSLKSMAKKYGIKIISGVAETSAHVHWFAKQHILGYTCDLQVVSI